MLHEKKEQELLFLGLFSFLLFFARLLVFLDKTRDKRVKEEGEREKHREDSVTTE